MWHIGMNKNNGLGGKCKSLRAYHRHNFPRVSNALHATCHTRTARVAHDEGADND